MITLLEDDRYALALDAITGEPVGLIEVERWIDNSLMTPPKADSVMYFLHTNGRYYKRALLADKIDMSWYLVPGGADNSPRWAKFLTYMRQASDVFYLTLVIPSKIYYYTYTVKFEGLRITFEGDSVHIFPPECTGWFMVNVANSYYRNNGTLRFRTTGASALDGIISVTDAGYLAWLTEKGITRDFTYKNGRTLGEILDAGGVMKSLRPSDYKYHAIYTTTVLYFPNVWADGFSGHGIYSYAPSIFQRDPVEAPDGYNTSLSNFNFSVIKSGGYGIVCEGADANQITVFMSDTRDCGVGGICDNSQSGMQVIAPHSAVNGWFDFAMLCYGNWSLAFPYGETSNTSRSILNGAGSRYGGPIKARIQDSYDGWNQVGNYVVKAVMGTQSITSELQFGDQGNRFNLLAFRNYGQNSDEINLRASIGGEARNQALLEIYEAGQATYRGQYTSNAGVAIENLLHGGLRHEVARGFIPASGRWPAGSTLTNSAYNGNNERLWAVSQAGLAPGDSYATLCGSTLTNMQGSMQKLAVSPATNFIQQDDVFTLAGMLVSVVYVYRNGSGLAEAIDISAPISVTGAMPVYRTAVFKAIS